MPKLAIEDFSAEKVEDGVYKVTALVGNRGYLPTNLTDEAFKLKVVKPVKVCLEGAKLLSGKAEEKIESLSGYSRTATGVFFYGNITTSASAPAKKKLSWIVQGKAGDVLKLTAANEKAGTKTKEITLP